MTIDTPKIHSRPHGGTAWHAQVAALCYRKGRRGKEILLITSRETRRWVIPKGWPKKGLKAHEAAAEEAWEEAGVRPEKLYRKQIGVYRYGKRMPRDRILPCRTAVFKLRVLRLEDAYPEAGQRIRKWLPPKEAARLVDEPELKALLRNF